MPGQEGVPSVYSPMARTLADLTYFARSIIGMKPWLYDHTVIPLEWRDQPQEKTTRLRIGVMRQDGVVPPSPACARALEQVVAALGATGHTIIDHLEPPSPHKGLVLASQLLLSDGGQTYRSSFRATEKPDQGVAQMNTFLTLPRPLRYLYYLWVRYIRRDVVWADLLRGFCSAMNTAHQWRLVARREAYRASWHAWWRREDVNLDVLLTVPNATPAVPHGAMKDAFSSCGYTFLFNLVRCRHNPTPNPLHHFPTQEVLPK